VFAWTLKQKQDLGLLKTRANAAQAFALAGVLFGRKPRNLKKGDLPLIHKNVQKCSLSTIRPGGIPRAFFPRKLKNIMILNQKTLPFFLKKYPPARGFLFSLIPCPRAAAARFFILSIIGLFQKPRKT